LIVEAPEVSEYPWETLFESGKYLSTHVNTPLIRFIPTVLPVTKNYRKPLKILIIGSNPSSTKVPALQLEEEIEAIEDALQKEIDDGQIKLKIERIAKIDRIWQKLKEDSYNIIHFIGHGIFQDNTGYLALVNENGGIDPVDHTRLGQILQNHQSMNTIGLMVLNACESAEMSTSRAFTGLAPELIRIGIPSVIAMRFNITNQMASLFAKEFYTNIPIMPIDKSLQMVRNRILVDKKTKPSDFVSPVLFTNSPDGTVFNMEEGP
jgi:CHAT domain-containing protein